MSKICWLGSISDRNMSYRLRGIIPDFIFSFYHWCWALFGALIYGFPSRKLKVIGVTGTKGKSSVVLLAGRILAAGGRRVGWISSLTINNGAEEAMNCRHMTMPGRLFIQKALRQMAKNGCEYALVEVTSEGIKQHRHCFIGWTGAVFTNLAPEHLEAHGGFASYRAAKEKLFKAVAKNQESFGIYNLEDQNAAHFLKYCIKNKYGYILKNNFPVAASDFRSVLKISDIRLGAKGSAFEINGVRFKTNLLGEFNVYNCAAAAAIGLAAGASLAVAVAALAEIKGIPGRLELIDEGQNFMAVVDLAHTPDSFEKVFELFKDLPHNKIIVVFGSAGGGRDKWKRPELGRIAGENADAAIICNEDPYDEDPRAISESIAAGCVKIKPEIIFDRRTAIGRGLSLARPGDIVLILGKGAEQVYIEGGSRTLWDDRLITREELRKIIF